MAWAFRSRCTAPGCTELAVDRGRCRAHGLDARRGSSTARGYGAAWQARRARFLRAHPLCAACLAEGRTTAATEVDHVRRRVTFADAREADAESNLQALCKPCHSRKTREDVGLARRRG